MNGTGTEKGFNEFFLLFALSSNVMITVNDVDLFEGNVFMQVSPSYERCEYHTIDSARDGDGYFFVFRDMGF